MLSKEEYPLIWGNDAALTGSMVNIAAAKLYSWNLSRVVEEV